MTQHSFARAFALTLAVGCSLVSNFAQAYDERGHRGEPARRDYVLDHRFNHDHYYPPRGYAVRALPPGYRSVYYRGSPFYFHGGAWYRRSGPGFVVVAPPFGAVLPTLPPFYTTVWFGGTPYYYADDAYYVWRPEQQGYVVTDPPSDATPVTNPPDKAPPDSRSDVFIYPKNGQSEQQQATDRYECHRWAADQTGFDPTQPAGGVPEDQAAVKRSDYSRAQTACLEGRGYTVK